MDDLLALCHAGIEADGTWEVGVQGSGRPSSVQAGRSPSWPRAVLIAVALVIAFGLVFAVVPDRIADALERRDVSSDGRDLVLVGWWLIGLVAIPWALSRLQRRGWL